MKKLVITLAVLSIVSEVSAENIFKSLWSSVKSRPDLSTSHSNLSRVGDSFFFYKLKPISSDKAIDILKKKPNTHINAQKTDTKEPLVYMSNKPILIGVKEKSKN